MYTDLAFVLKVIRSISLSTRTLPIHGHAHVKLWTIFPSNIHIDMLQSLHSCEAIRGLYGIVAELMSNVFLYNSCHSNLKGKTGGWTCIFVIVYNFPKCFGIFSLSFNLIYRYPLSLIWYILKFGIQTTWSFRECLLKYELFAHNPAIGNHLIQLFDP